LPLRVGAAPPPPPNSLSVWTSSSSDGIPRGVAPFWRTLNHGGLEGTFRVPPRSGTTLSTRQPHFVHTSDRGNTAKGRRRRPCVRTRSGPSVRVRLREREREREGAPSVPTRYLKRTSPHGERDLERSPCPSRGRCASRSRRPRSSHPAPLPSAHGNPRRLELRGLSRAHVLTPRACARPSGEY